MEIKIINIKEENIKKIRKYLRSWKKRKNGATLMDVVCALNLGYETTKETLDWMFRGGDVIITHGYQMAEPHYHCVK